MFDVTEADEGATSKERALDNLREQLAGHQTMGIVNLYEEAAFAAHRGWTL